MKEPIVFFNVKDPKRNALTKVGYKVINTNGQLVVYCTDDGPLDEQYRSQWLEWRRSEDAKN